MFADTLQSMINKDYFYTEVEHLQGTRKHTHDALSELFLCQRNFQQTYTQVIVVTIIR